MSTDPSDRFHAKRVVLDFFDPAFVRREPAGGLFTHAPEASFHLERAIAEDDLVVLHYNLKLSADDPGRAVVDIFRAQDGQIVEHWDVVQPVPAEAANDNACSGQLRRRVLPHAKTRKYLLEQVNCTDCTSDDELLLPESGAPR